MMAKNCLDCGAANADAAKFCNECGLKFEEEVTGETVKQTQPVSIAEKLNAKMEAFAAQRSQAKADILFVLDCTGSMQGEIDAIRDAIVSVVEAIEEDGVESRVGLLEFRDRLYGEEHRVLTFDGEVFTKDAKSFQAQVGKLKAGGGGDRPESSLDALLYATQQPFEPEAKKVIVLITDAPPHIPDREVQSVDEVLNAFHQAGIHQFYPVMHTQDEESKVYLRLFTGRKGLAFELGKGEDFRARAEHFKRTLISLQKTISQATMGA
ncbi:VWA domain-containing protein [Lyngbya confervoides]|uniref:VWA domain-containing protein n=1 Tax=Lyngbya confervoides BDU141951 TaxID=1574623 RepID=A0ABD4T0V0_9CYAN|nr:VWA domain-containing protein [Lyngbya confervoides]MCM1982401.1 VWA domain-containing protein [Lyngbya confervoides BDU141951]